MHEAHPPCQNDESEGYTAALDTAAPQHHHPLRPAPRGRAFFRSHTPPGGYSAALDEDAASLHSSSSSLPSCGDGLPPTTTATATAQANPGAGDGWGQRLKDVWLGVSFSAPITLVLGLQFLTSTLNGVYIVQKLGEDAFTGFNLAGLTGNLIGMSFVMGMQSAGDTLLPIAMGAKRYSDIGDTIVLSTALSLGLLLLALPAWLNGEAILLSIGQPAVSAEYAGRYLRVFPFYITLLGLYENLRRFLACQDILWPFVGFSALGLASQALFLWIFFDVFETGFIGAAWAQVLNQLITLATAFAWASTARPHHPGTWVGVRRSAFSLRRTIDYLRLAIPGLLTLSEWWYWELICFFTGWISLVAQSAHACAYFIVPFYFLLILGLGAGANIRIGQAIGEGDVDRARSLRNTFIPVGLLMSTACALGHYALGGFQIRALSGGDAEVMSLAEKVWPFVALFVFFDTQYAMQSSIVRALGLQFYIVPVVVGSLWVVSLPVIYYLTFTQGQGILGIWRVFPAGHALLMVGTTCIHALTPWEVVAEREAEKSRQKAAMSAGAPLAVVGAVQCGADGLEEEMGSDGAAEADDCVLIRPVSPTQGFLMDRRHGCGGSSRGGSPVPQLDV